MRSRRNNRRRLIRKRGITKSDVICDGASEKREKAGSLPFGSAQGRNDNQKNKSNRKDKDASIWS